MSKINTFIVPIIRPDYIERMLLTLHKFNEKDTFNVIVIDQTTTKEAQEKCEKYAHLWIKTYRNLGFSKAMNTGILLSNTPYITLCNDDIEFMNKKWWQGIVDTFATDPNIVAVNPMSPKEGSWGYGYRSDNADTWVPPEEYVTDDTKLSVYPKKPNGEGLFYKEEFTEDDYEFLVNNHPRYKKNTMVDAIAMWCTVFKREGLEELGLLEERFYPGGGEDYDMNARAYSCAYPKAREECDPRYHRRMVSTTKSWVWHYWGKSKDDLAAKYPSSPYFTSRPRWNDNSELWGPYFDVWGHETLPDGTKKPLKRLKPVTNDEL